MTREDSTQLDHLLETWYQTLGGGQAVSPEDHCRQFPHLTLEFVRRVGALPKPNPPAWADPITIDASNTAPTRVAADTVNAPAFQPGQEIGGYVLVRLIGQGGMGEVWEADDIRLPRKVAVKLMQPKFAADPTIRERFTREARAQALIQHANVVPVYWVGDHAGTPFIVMPLLAGESLADRLKRTPVLPAAELLRIGAEAATGLAVAHDKGLIHRDVKPANIWLNSDGPVQLLDFGVARAVRENPMLVSITHNGAVIGTPAYMAPEQAAGAAVNERADLFSIGVMLYEMGTGVHPFKCDSVIATLNALANVTPPGTNTLNPELPAAFSDLIDRLLTKTAGERWPTSAAELACLLTQLGTAEASAVVIPPKPAPVGAIAEPLRRGRRSRWLLLLLLLLIALISGLALWGSGYLRTPEAVIPAPTPTDEDRLRAFVARLREQSVEHRCEMVNKGGAFGVRKNHLRFTGTTGVPMCSDIENGKATVKVRYDGTYIRDFVEVIVPMHEVKTVGGVIVVSVTVGQDGVRVTDIEQKETDGEVTSTGHDAQKCAKAAVTKLVNRAAEDVK